MAHKEKIDALRECLRTEEAAIPVYSKHVSDALFLSGIKQEGQAKVRDILEKLKNDSLRHRAILEAILTQLEKAK